MTDSLLLQLCLGWSAANFQLGNSNFLRRLKIRHDRHYLSLSWRTLYHTCQNNWIAEYESFLRSSSFQTTRFFIYQRIGRKKPLCFNWAFVKEVTKDPQSHKCYRTLENYIKHGFSGLGNSINRSLQHIGNLSRILFTWRMSDMNTFYTRLRWTQRVIMYSKITTLRPELTQFFPSLPTNLCKTW